MLAISIWTIFSLLEGLRDGVMYHLKDPNSSSGFNEHIVFSAIRLLVLILIGIIDPQQILPAMLVFSFLHNGAYYLTRDILEPGTYPYRFLDQSFTSTALTTKFFTPVNRTVLAIIGFILSTLLIIFPII